MSTTIATVSAIQVSDDQRMAFLPKHIGTGMAMIEFEAMVFANLESMSKEYRGGYWEFYELSNRGFYMAPQMTSELTLDCPGNGFSGAVSADAAGIVATLYSLSHMSFKYAGKPVGSRCADNYQRLLAFADEHPQGRLIFGAID
jgi:hypothetical protein